MKWRTAKPDKLRYAWLGIFLTGLLIPAIIPWLMIFVDTQTDAGRVPFDLHSDLWADYSQDPYRFRIGAVALNIIEEAIRDDTSGGEAQSRIATLQGVLQTPVATITPIGWIDVPTPTADQSVFPSPTPDNPLGSQTPSPTVVQGGSTQTPTLLPQSPTPTRMEITATATGHVPSPTSVLKKSPTPTRTKPAATKPASPPSATPAPPTATNPPPTATRVLPTATTRPPDATSTPRSYPEPKPTQTSEPYP